MLACSNRKFYEKAILMFLKDLTQNPGGKQFLRDLEEIMFLTKYNLLQFRCMYIVQCTRINKKKVNIV